MDVSIIITCYNREKFIGRAIRSAINQNFSQGKFEVIVVDDGSTDHSREIIKDFNDEIITIFHKENRGLPSARNSGIKKAKGRYIVNLDSDDYMHNDLIATQYLFMVYNNEWGGVECDYMQVDEHENHIQRKSAKDYPIACGIMFRKENLIRIGLYDESMLVCEDEELRKRYEANYKIHHLQLPFYRYTRHDNNITNNVEKVFKYKQQLSEK